MRVQPELEQRLRVDARELDPVFPSSVSLERRILARAAASAREERRALTFPQELALAGLLVVAVALLGLGFAQLRATTKPEPARRVGPPLTLVAPEGIAVGPDGRVYVSDYAAGYVFRVGADGRLTIVAGTGKRGEGGDGGPAIGATLWSPSGLSVDRNGNLFVAENHGSGRVRRVDSRGIITTVAGKPGPDQFTVGQICPDGDGGPATAACLSYPLGLAVDRSGMLYVGDTSNASVRRISPNQIITSVDDVPLAAQPWSPGYLAVDSRGSLYVADRNRAIFGLWLGTGGCRIFRVSQAGWISLVAGTGTCGFSGDGARATAAQLNDPNGLAFDSAGNLYVADSDNHRIRRIDRNGIITTVAGTGTAGRSGDSGPGIRAQLNHPFGIAIAGDKLYVAEGGSGRVRVLDLSTGIIATVTR